MDSLHGLYYDTVSASYGGFFLTIFLISGNQLHRQNHQQVAPWFTANPMKYQFLLAGTPPATALPVECKSLF